MSILGGGVPPRSGGDGGAKGSTDLIAITEGDFETEVLQSDLPVLIFLTTNRLEIAAALDGEAAAVAADLRGKMKFVRIDVDKSPKLVRELQIREIPTYMIFKDQGIVDTQTVPLNKKKLAAFVEAHLPRAAGALKAPELAQLLKEGAVVPVDTREAAAYGRAHLPGAVNIPAEEIEGRLAELHMLAGEPVVYCRSGDKTKDLAATLAEAGVPVAFLEGGLLAWEAEGLPIKRP